MVWFKERPVEVEKMVVDVGDYVTETVILPILVQKVVGGTMVIVLAEAKIHQNLPVNH